MRARSYIVGGLVALVLLAVAAPAAPAAELGVPLAVLGIEFPSVRSVVEDVVRFFFSTFLDALVPDWLKDGSVDLLKRLVAVPDPTDQRVWPTLARVAEAMRWISIPLMSLAAVAAWTQQWINEVTGRPASFEAALSRTGVAAVLLVSYVFFLGDAVALVNTITNAMLSVPAVGQGLERTVGLVFAGSLLSGNGLLLALLGIAGVVLGVGLFLMSVGLLVLFGILYTSAPLAIACSIADETQGVWTAWRFTLLTAALVPIGWCVLFATAGAFVLDMTRWSGGIAGELGTRLTGVFAALIILYLAVRWPLMLWGAIRMKIAGALMTVGGSRGVVGGGQQHAGGRAARAALQRTTLRVADSMTNVLGGARSAVMGSARMALGGAIAGGGVAGAAGVARGDTRQAGQAGGRTVPVVSPVHAAAAGVRDRVRAASDASRRALESGHSATEALGAAVVSATSGSEKSADRRNGRGSGAGAPGRRPTRPAQPPSSAAPARRTGRSNSSGRSVPADGRAQAATGADSDERSGDPSSRASRKRRAQPPSVPPGRPAGSPSTSDRLARTGAPRRGAVRRTPSRPPASARSAPKRSTHSAAPSASAKSSPGSSRVAPTVRRDPRGRSRSMPTAPRTPERPSASPARPASSSAVPPRPVQKRPVAPARPRRPDRTRKKR